MSLSPPRRSIRRKIAELRELLPHLKHMLVIGESGEFAAERDS